MLLNEIFNQIYLIHLKELNNRYLNCIEEFKKIDLKISDIHIIDGVKYNGGVSVEDRIIGCKLSHNNCIIDASKNKYKKILILEDDFVFHNNFNNYLPQINNFILNNDWELFYFGGNLKEPPIKTNINNICNIKNILTTHCYAINNIFDELLKLKSEYKLNYNDDLILVEKIQNRGKTFVHIPRLAYQSNGFSYIRQGVRNYMNLYKDPS